MKLYYTIFLFLCISIFASSGCDNPIEPDVPAGFTIEDEKKLGDRIHEAIVNTSMLKILDDAAYPDAAKYISNIRVQLIGTNYMEHRYDFDWAIHIIDNDNIKDCFTTIGGQIYIYTGLLKSLHNESQLLGILAHEMFYADKSYHTEILKSNYNLTILLDVSYGGEDLKALEMLYKFYNKPRNTNKVLEADQYGLALLCLTQTKAEEMKTAIEDAYYANNTWYQNHSHPTTSSFQLRKNYFLANIDTTCGGTDSRETQYRNFIQNNLP